MGRAVVCDTKQTQKGQKILLCCARLIARVVMVSEGGMCHTTAEAEPTGVWKDEAHPSPSIAHQQRAWTNEWATRELVPHQLETLTKRRGQG